MTLHGSGTAALALVLLICGAVGIAFTIACWQGWTDRYIGRHVRAALGEPDLPTLTISVYMRRVDDDLHTWRRIDAEIAMMEARLAGLDDAMKDRDRQILDHLLANQETRQIYIGRIPAESVPGMAELTDRLFAKGVIL